MLLEVTTYDGKYDANVANDDGTNEHANYSRRNARGIEGVKQSKTWIFRQDYQILFKRTKEKSW